MNEIRILHLSDLHFSKEKDYKIWQEVQRFINDVVRPDAILVTGDVTDNALESEFELAKRSLDGLRLRTRTDGPAYRIIPGNHDRYDFLGNRFRFWRRGYHLKETLFEKYFGTGEHVLGNACDLELRSQHDNWKVRVIGLDSNAAQWFAQGAIDEVDIIRASRHASAGEATDRDLVIALVHHHILAIPSVERQKAGKGGKRGMGNLAGVLDATGMLNSGVLLEHLSKSQVNIVLHGHEHARFQAVYRGTSPDAGSTVVLGAGSGTGERTLSGWSLSDIHFNVLQLHADRRVVLLEGGYVDTGLALASGPVLLSGRDIRRARFIRRHRLGTRDAVVGARSLPTSRLKKLVLVDCYRNAEMVETSTDFVVGEEWSFKTSNSSGYVSDLGVEFEFLTTPPEIFTSPFFPSPNAPDEFSCGIPLEKRDNPLAKRITARWTWNGAVVLTKHELLNLPHSARCGIRAMGREFVGLEIEKSDEFEYASLTVHIPEDFAPDRSAFKVFVEEPEKQGKYVPSEELTERLEFCGRGHVELRIPYPMPEYSYYISWELPPDHSLPYSDRLAINIEKNATALFKNISQQIVGIDDPNALNIALYAVKGEKLIRVEGNSLAPTSLDASDPRSLERAALWGDTRVLYHEATRERNSGFVAFVPVRPILIEGCRAAAILRVALDRTGVIEYGAGTGVAHSDTIMQRVQAAASELAQRALDFER